MPIKPLELSSPLHNAPSSKPKYMHDVKSKSGDTISCADPRYVRAYLALMNLGAVNGGAACHWGGPSAMVEFWSALHAKMFQEEKWYEKYNFVNDIGHAENGIYALRAILGYGDLTQSSLKGFRSIDSKLTGHGESHLYPEGVLLSNGPLSSALPQAQGLAFADKLKGSDRVSIITMSDGACMEGEAKESLAAIPGLSKKGKLNPFILVVSDNNTKLSGRIEEDAFDMKPSFESMQALGWEVLKIEKGNDLTACYHGIEESIELAKNSTKPVFVWLKTVKGQGVKATETSSSGGHGFPLKAYSVEVNNFLAEIFNDEVPSEFNSWVEELTTKPKSSSKSEAGIKVEKAQAGFAKGAAKAAEAGYPVYSVSSDLQGSTGMKAFQQQFPEHFVDLGIAEANMVSHAAGMSKAGFIPIVDTFAAFGVTKGNLPLVMASLSECPLIAVFSHVGFQDAADGASHQSLTYLSALGSIPNVKTIIVSCSAEAEAFMFQAIEDIAKKRKNNEVADSYIFFVGRENFPAHFESEQSFKLGQANLLRSGNNGVIVAAGAVLYKALNVANDLDASVIVNSCANKPDTELIAKELQKCSKLLTIEDHQVVGGYGAQLIHALKQEGLDFKSKSLGVNGVFGQSAYKADELYAKHGLVEKDIEKAFNQL